MMFNKLPDGRIVTNIHGYIRLMLDECANADSDKKQAKLWDAVIQIRGTTTKIPMFLSGYAENLTLAEYYELEFADFSIVGKQITYSVKTLDQMLDVVNAGINLYFENKNRPDFTRKQKDRLRKLVILTYQNYRTIVNSSMKQNGVAA